MINPKNIMGFCLICLGMAGVEVTDMQHCTSIQKQTAFLLGMMFVLTGIILWCIPSAEEVAKKVKKKLKE